MYGGPSAGESGSITFSLANNLEMKVRNDNDTTGKEPFKKISLIDNFSLNGSYNLMADSMNLSSIGMNPAFETGQEQDLEPFHATLTRTCTNSTATDDLTEVGTIHGSTACSPTLARSKLPTR